MFTAHLEEAAKARREDVTPLSPSLARSTGQDLVHLTSEFLFDLWDANLTQAFQEMEQFEQDIMPHVLSLELPQGEYTFEMEEDHRQFCTLFERLVGNFLLEHGASVEELYEELARKEARSRERGEAGEIMDVVLWATNFGKWADDMKERARHRLIHGY